MAVLHFFLVNSPLYILFSMGLANQNLWQYLSLFNLEDLYLKNGGTVVLYICGLSEPLRIFFSFIDQVKNSENSQKCNFKVS